MKLRIFVSLLAMLVVTSCSRPAALVIAEVTIEAKGYSIEKTHYESVSELIAGLKAMPRLDGIGITELPGADHARVAETIKAMQSAGITVPIAMVGNDVYK